MKRHEGRKERPSITVTIAAQGKNNKLPKVKSTVHRIITAKKKVDTKA